MKLCHRDRFLLNLQLFLLDGMANYRLRLLQDEKPGGSQRMVIVWNFGLDDDTRLRKFDRGLGDQQVPVRRECQLRESWRVHAYLFQDNNVKILDLALLRHRTRRK